MVAITRPPRGRNRLPGLTPRSGDGAEPEAAVGDDLGAGREPCLVGGGEEDEVGDLVRGGLPGDGETVDRHQFAAVGTEGEVRLDDAGVDGADAATSSNRGRLLVVEGVDVGGVGEASPRLQCCEEPPAPKLVRASPGSTIVTPMPNGATSAAVDSQKPSMPHLVAWWRLMAGKAIWPPMLAIWMYRPPPWRRRCGVAARASWIEAVRLVAIRPSSAHARSVTSRSAVVSVTSRLARQSRSPWRAARSSRVSGRRAVAATRQQAATPGTLTKHSAGPFPPGRCRFRQTNDARGGESPPRASSSVSS
jgi:hypothetical protein